MTTFTIGGGQKYKMAKALPNGTHVRISSVEVKESKIKRKDGGKQHQTCIVFEALVGGTTLPFQKGPANNRQTIEAEAFEAGEKFVHYYGGIFEKDDGSGWRISERGGTYQFLSTLAELGVPVTGKFEDYVGVELTLNRVQGMGAQGVYYTPLPGEVTGKAEAQGEGPAVASKPRPSFKKKAPAAEDNAYLALIEEDREAVDEYVQECGGTGMADADDLVGTVATDLAHAKAILAGYDAKAGA